MRISWRRAALVLPGLMLACSVHSSDHASGSSGSSSSSGSGGGGCGSGASDDGYTAGTNVKDAPSGGGARTGAPSEPAPTGQSWKPVETDTCGRGGITWVLVDEVCGDGEGNDDPDSLTAPMFRDGAVIDDHLFAVDATHLWTYDLTLTSESARTSLMTGLGTPLAVDRRGSELVLAAGASGLVMVDVTNAASPTRSRSIALAGTAFDVQVTGDRAFVALGSGGIAEVDLGAATPSITHAWPLAGFSAGIAARDGYAYVAACGTFKVVDLGTGQVVSQAWVPNAMVGGRLAAPAKKVTLVGNVAFVAAGRYGAVAIDVTDPTKPSVLGNCTIGSDPSFYASGVRASGGTLYVAGGEWGILPVAVANPQSACKTLLAQAPSPQSSAPASQPCSADPPWTVVPWETIWSPPPPRRDPVQTLPAGDRVYAFGDARRIGVRSVDVRNALDPTLPTLGRFDEPRALLGVAASASRLVAVGPRGGVFAIGANGQLTRTPSADDATLKASTAVTLLEDGRWVALGSSSLAIEGKTKAIAMAQPGTLAAGDGARVVFTSQNAVYTIDVDTAAQSMVPILQAAHLPLSLAADASGVYYAAPEWSAAAVFSGSKSTPVAPHGVFDDEAIMDASLWRTRLPRRHLLATGRGLVEVAGVGSKAGLVVHDSAGLKKVTLPAITYAASATDGDHVYIAGIDRGLYKSYLVSVDISGVAPVVRSVEAFSGAASGVAVAAGHVFVADADGALRTFDVTANGSAVPTGSTEVTP